MSLGPRATGRATCAAGLAPILFALLLIDCQKPVAGPDQPTAGGRISADVVTVKVNAAVEHQKLAGFGSASPGTLWHPGPQTLSDSLRATAVEKAYGQVRLNLGRIGTLVESPGSYDQRQNDDNDPFHTNWSGFSAEYLDQAKKYVIDLARPFGFSAYLGGAAPNVRWASPWLASVRRQDYSRFLDEAAEQVLADLTWWKKTYGEEPPLYELGNEQISGDRALMDPDIKGFGKVNPVQQMVDITARAGARIRAAGFLKTRFIVGIEETEGESLKVATAILNNSKAAQYVGVIGYHAYPYMKGYSSIRFILRTSGAGRPDPDRTAVRNGIRDLAFKHNVEAWMTENSNAGEATSYDDFRARAIQIHDEFAYADAAAYFAMSSMWDLFSSRAHFHNDNLNREGTAVLIDNATGTMEIAGIGHAIGHYARWIKPGATRVDAIGSDPLIQVTAFHDKALHRVGLVLINNSRDFVTVHVSLNGLALSAGLDGEQSTPAAYWEPLTRVPRESSSAFQIRLPPISVTSLAGPTTD